MTQLCAATNPSPFTTGQMAGGDERVFRPGGLELTAHAIALAHLKSGAAILDLGCGVGQTVCYLRGLGFSAKGIDRRAGSGDASTAPWRIVGRAEELPLADGSLDAVLAECTLSLIADQGRVLAECARVLRDGGSLIISDLYARQPEMIGGVRALRGSCVAGMIVRTELEAQLAQNGLQVDAWEDHSRALRECAARFIMERGSCEGLWGGAAGTSAGEIERATRAARAGYFLLIANRTRRCATERGKNS